MALPDESPLRASVPLPGTAAAPQTAEEKHWAATVAQLRQEVRREAEEATQRSGAADDPWIEVRSPTLTMPLCQACAEGCYWCLCLQVVRSAGQLTTCCTPSATNYESCTALSSPLSVPAVHQRLHAHQSFAGSQAHTAPISQGRTQMQYMRRAAGAAAAQPLRQPSEAKGWRSRCPCLDFTAVDDNI